MSTPPDPGPSLGEIVGTAGVALTVIALILAGIQFLEARRQTSRLAEQSSALGFIAGSLSTRYLGPFPEYLSSVTDLVETAQQEVQILNGNPTPAYYTSPALWTRYSQAVQRKAQEGVLVSLVCMGESERRERLRLQFPTSDEAWIPWKAANSTRVEEFLKYRFRSINIQELGYEEMHRLLLQVQTDLLREAFEYQGVRVSQVDKLVPVQVWIVDDKSAVFAIQTSPSFAISHGLFTSDPQFVAALKAMIVLYS